MYRIHVPPEVRIEFGNFYRQRNVSSSEGFFHPFPRCCQQALANRCLLFPRAPRGDPESQGHEPVVLVAICNMETASGVGTDPHASRPEHSGTLHGFCHCLEKPVTVEVRLEVLGVLDCQVRHRQYTVSRAERDRSRKCFTPVPCPPSPRAPSPRHPCERAPSFRAGASNRRRRRSFPGFRSARR